MKYYKLDSVEKEFHNQLLVNTLRNFVDPAWLNENGRGDVSGAVITVSREGAVRAAMVNIYNIGDIAGVKEWWEETWKAFGGIDPKVENSDFDHQFNVLIDETLGKLYRVKNDESRIIPTCMAFEELRGFVAEVVVATQWEKTKSLLGGKMLELYLNKRLDEKFVEKLLQPVYDADDRKEFTARINALIGYFTTPMN